MKCPKCNYDNPSGIRYCLKCNASLIPPIPKPTRPKQENHPDKIIFPIVIAIILSVVVVATIGLIGVSIYIANVQTRTVLEQHDIVQNEEATGFADLESGILHIPESDLTLDFPNYVSYVYDYSPESGQLLFEIKTEDDLTITFTSSRINAGTYSKSETQASQQQNGLYYAIEGTESEYYYILPSKEGTIYGTIIDAYANRIVNVTVVDNTYVEKTLPNETSQNPEEDGSVNDSQQSMIDESDQIDEDSSFQDSTTESSGHRYDEEQNQISCKRCINTIEEIMQSTGIQ